LTGEETSWTLTLPMTSMIEWKGVKAKPSEGSATPENFIYKLSRYAEQHAAEWNLEPIEAIRAALTSLASGGVVAEIRIPRVTHPTNNNSWSVLSFTPIYVELGIGDDTYEDEAATAAAGALQLN